MIDQKI